MDEDFESTEKAFSKDSPELLKNLPPKAETHIENLAESSEINRKPLFEKGIELILFKMNSYGIYPMKLILIFLIPKLRSIHLTMLASHLFYAFSNAIYRIAKNQPHHSQRIYFIFFKYHFLYKNYGINKVNISTNLADIEETFIQLEFPIKYLKGILKDYQ